MVIVGKGKVEENQSIFDGSTWQSYTGGDTNVLEPYPFNELPTKKKVDIRYMGWTAKTDVEIEQIGLCLAKQTLAPMLTSLSSKRTSGKRNIRSSVEPATAKHSPCT